MKEYSNVNRITDCDHLTDVNWHEWKERMKRVFINCDITWYVTGEITHPNEYEDPDGTCNWDKNDTWAQQVIIHNVTASQMNHVGSKDTAEEMYSALLVTHDNMAHQTVNYLQNQLYETKSHDGEDLLKHLDILKSYCDCINWFLNINFHVLDTRFKSIILASLPVLWQMSLNLIMEMWMILMTSTLNDGCLQMPLLVYYMRSIKFMSVEWIMGRVLVQMEVLLWWPKPDCITCTEVKQHIESFPKSVNWSTEPRELTHIDPWGKSTVKSINSNQYYLLFIDDAKCNITINFPKEKSDVAQAVINYIAQLLTQGWKLKGIQIDCENEFINKKLKTNCKEHGINIHLMALTHLHKMELQSAWIRYLYNLHMQCSLQTIFLNSFGSMQPYTPPTYRIDHSWNICKLQHHIRSGIMKNQMYHTYVNSVLPFGSCYKDKKRTEKCYWNWNAEFTVVDNQSLLVWLTNYLCSCQGQNRF